MARKEANEWTPDHLPPMQDEQFLQLTTEERRMLGGPGPTKGQLQHIFQHPAFRHFCATVKRQANTWTNQLVSGVGLPGGLEQASPREAYFIALVNASRATLNLQRELWEAAVAQEGDDEQPEPERKVPPEEPLGLPETMESPD